jgi:hypothetical protein
LIDFFSKPEFIVTLILAKNLFLLKYVISAFSYKGKLTLLKSQIRIFHTQLGRFKKQSPLLKAAVVLLWIHAYHP